MQLDTFQSVALFGGVSFLVGVLLTIVIALIVWSNKMNQRAAEENVKQQIMQGLNRSCEGVESVISGIALSSVDLPRLKKELVRRVTTLETRLEEYLEELDQYYAAYIALRLDGYRQLVYKIDEFGATIARFGNAEAAQLPTTTPEPEGGEVAGPEGPGVAAEEPAIVAQAAPMPPPVSAPPGPPPSEAPEVDMSGELDFAEAPTVAGPVAQGPAPAPQPPQPMGAAPGDAGISDDDLMYGQTMQFSMTDIEAARQGMAPTNTAPLSEPMPPQAPAESEQAFSLEPQQGGGSPMLADDMGETLVFASDEVDDTQQPQQPAAPAAQMQAPPAPPPPRPQAQQGEQKKKADGMISGDDLMNQMDSFFNFDS